MLEMWLRDLDKIRELLASIIKDIKAYCGEEYIVSSSGHNLSILLEPATPEVKEDMINHWERITGLIKKINAYFIETKESLKAKIEEAISS